MARGLAGAIGLAIGVMLSAQVLAQPTFADTPRLSKSCEKVAIGAGKEMRCIAPASGRTLWFKDCPQCPDMVVVPRGKFVSGSPSSEKGRSPRESQSRVSIGKPFAVGRFAVTFAEWESCVADGGCNGYQPSDDGNGRANLPVVRVNWDDANAYVRWLSQKSGRPYRLLSSDEREYVTRAGTASPYWWGASVAPGQANVDSPDTVVRTPQGNSVQPAQALRRPAPVDSYAANPWGLYNVHGNVWEWTGDCWRDDGPLTAAQDRQDRKSAPMDCGQRIARGGSWYDFASEARSAARIGFDATSRNALLGFRVARTLQNANRSRK